MPQRAATIRNVSKGFRLIKEMSSQGTTWSEDYRIYARKAVNLTFAIQRFCGRKCLISRPWPKKVGTTKGSSGITVSTPKRGGGCLGSVNFNWCNNNL